MQLFKCQLSWRSSRWSWFSFCYVMMLVQQISKFYFAYSSMLMYKFPFKCVVLPFKFWFTQNDFQAIWRFGLVTRNLFQVNSKFSVTINQFFFLVADETTSRIFSWNYYPLVCWGEKKNLTNESRLYGRPWANGKALKSVLVTFYLLSNSCEL